MLKSMKKKALLLTAVFLSAVTMVAVIPGGALKADSLSQNQYYTSDYETKSEALEAANALNEKIVEEGIVLLKNQGNALPLADGAKISVFGKNSVNLVYGVSGSGGKSADEAVTLHESLAAAGFYVNPVLQAFYENNSLSGPGRQANPAMDGGENITLYTGETPQSSYTQALKDSYNQYRDAALVVFSRIGGEGFDLPRVMGSAQGARNADDHYLQLDRNETDLLAAVCGAGFGHVIIVINSNSPMELGFLDDPGHYAYNSGIGACLWIGNPGETGINALGRVLKGTVNPSGRLPDTYARDFKKDPTWQNFGNNFDGGLYTYDGGKTGTVNSSYAYVDYEEGIYTGYRYWETRAIAEGEAWYKNNVVYPFGYGLSYTEFAQEIVNKASLNNAALTAAGTLSVQVKVTNTGMRKGKDVIQLYVTVPYLSGGIEKAHVVLAGFAKTPEINSGDNVTVTVEIDPYDFASYDYSDKNMNGFKGYELEAGAYTVKLSRNAHEAFDSFTCNVATAGLRYQNDPVTGYKLTNRYDDASVQLGSVLSRESWAATFPMPRTEAQKKIDAVTEAKINSVDTNNPFYTDVFPTQGVGGTVMLYEMIGKAYDDPLWDILLDRLTIIQMADLAGKGAFKTIAIDSIGKPETVDADGTAGLVNFMADPSVYGTCHYASECVIAATWNDNLAFEFGKSIGNESLFGNERGDGRPYSGWYAPGVNIHRSQFCGRFGEYFSEDGLLSGMLAASVIQGAMDKGVYTYVKHFAVNEQETYRAGICTWLTEQALREIYLKPFEKAVKAGGARGVMSSFNRIGTMWTGGDYRLLTEILRNEWGFRGMAVSEFNVSSYMDPKQMAYAGGDLNLTLSNQWSPQASSAADITILRQACKNILYTVANSNAMNGIGEGSGWQDNELEFVSGVNLLAATAGTPFLMPLSVRSVLTGDTVAASFDIQSGSLPKGLTLGAGGIVRGTPSSPGIYRFTVRASASGWESADKEFTMAVIGLAYQSEELPAGKLNQEYSASVGHAESFGTLGKTAYALKSGNVLPAGLFLDETTGVISGTPSEVCAASFTIVAKSGLFSREAEFTIQVLSDGTGPGTTDPGTTDPGKNGDNKGGCSGSAGVFTLIFANMLLIFAALAIRRK